MERGDPTLGCSMATEPKRLRPGELKEIRRLLGWTQERMARHLRVSRNAITRWETGLRVITPSHTQLIRLVANARGVNARFRRRRQRRVTEDLVSFWMGEAVTSKAVKQRVDAAITKSKREPEWLPDSAGQSADWPKQTDDRIAIPTSQPKGEPNGNTD